MILEEFKKIKSDTPALKSFGKVVGGVFCAIGALLWWKQAPAAAAVLSVGAALVAGGLFAPRLLLPVQKAWMALAVVIGWVMTRVILGLMFYLVITPIGLIMRRQDLLKEKFPGGADSYWLPHKGMPEKASYEKQF